MDDDVTTAVYGSVVGLNALVLRLTPAEERGY